MAPRHIYWLMFCIGIRFTFSFYINSLHLNRKLRIQLSHVNEFENAHMIEVAEVPQKVQKYTYAENSPIVRWKCSSKSKKIVKEGKRGLLEYLSLPPTEYSLLDPTQISRLENDIFLWNVKEMNFFGNKLRPVMSVQVKLDPDTQSVEIKVIDASIIGSEDIVSASKSFTLESSTIISCSSDDGGKKYFKSTTNLCIDVKIPNENWIPLTLIETGGNMILKTAQKILLDQLVRYLVKDYTRWAEGDDSRAPVVDEVESEAETE